MIYVRQTNPVGRLESDFRNHSFVFTTILIGIDVVWAKEIKRAQNSNKCYVPLFQTKVTHFGNVTNVQKMREK